MKSTTLYASLKINRLFSILLSVFTCALLIFFSTEIVENHREIQITPSFHARCKVSRGVSETVARFSVLRTGSRYRRGARRASPWHISAGSHRPAPLHRVIIALLPVSFACTSSPYYMTHGAANLGDCAFVLSSQSSLERVATRSFVFRVTPWLLQVIIYWFPLSDGQTGTVSDRASKATETSKLFFLNHPFFFNARLLQTSRKSEKETRLHIFQV